MQCPCKSGEGIETILAYLGGRLEPDTVAGLEAHLQECPACQELLLAQQLVWDSLDAWKPAAVSADFDRRLYEKIEAEDRRYGWWRRLFQPAFGFSFRPAMAMAAACLILVAVLLLRSPGEPPVAPVASAEPVDIEQMEKMVEDLDMLYLIDPVALDEAAPDETSTKEGVGVVMISFGKKRCA